MARAADAARRPTDYAQLKDEYANLWGEMAIRPARRAEVDAVVNRILRDKDRYVAVESATHVPWFVVAVIHSMEAGGDFSCHLHNGDPLTRRTVHVPAGRPLTGDPPFRWEVSAADALELQGLTRVTDWCVERVAYVCEGYNGWGYRLYHPRVKSPYLWSFSNHYTQGKYVADGRWSDTAVSQQCGAMVLLKRLEERGEVDLESTAPTAPRSARAVAPPQRYWPLGTGHVVTSLYGPRDGGFHLGTDFAFRGGSGNRPVYAVQSGTVQFAGAAQGYGGPDPAGWLVIDSSAAEGGGCVEYGHIVREVARGEHVIAGQRIAHINPDRATNGRVAPHLHLSVMPREYNPGAKIDPLPWLGQARDPVAARW